MAISLRDVGRLGGTLRQLREQLSAGVDAASLAVFRILLGCVMTVAMVRLLAKGWIKTIYLDPAFHFPWCSWITPLPGDGMYYLVSGLGILALGIALGLCFRACAVLFFIGFTYLEFIDRTTYLNHYYLATLLSGLLIFLRAHSKWSIDGLISSHVSTDTVPRWQVLLLRFQIGVVFIFAGLAKLNPDWLLAAQPMRTWLMAKSDLPLIGSWLAEPAVAYAASWFGAAYDLSIPFLLMASVTRRAASLAVLFFHLMTALLFPIGMFPWIMMAASLIFLPPDWPRRVFCSRSADEGGIPAFRNDTAPPLSQTGTILLAAYCATQILIPLRSWFYPQQGAWDMRGFNFSWRVMLVEKTGDAVFYKVAPGTRIRERISTNPYITKRQRMMMAQDPHLIRQFAQYLGRELDVGKTGYEILVDSFATMNGHPSQRLVRAGINLASEKPHDWIIPFAQSK